MICCALKGNAGEVYNLASGVETTIAELATLINSLTDNPTPIDFKPARAWDRSGKRFGATEKAQQKIGFKAKVALHEGLQKTIAWTNDNEARITAVMARHQYFMEATTS